MLCLGNDSTKWVANKISNPIVYCCYYRHSIRNILINFDSVNSLNSIHALPNTYAGSLLFTVKQFQIYSHTISVWFDITLPLSQTTDNRRLGLCNKRTLTYMGKKMAKNLNFTVLPLTLKVIE